VTEPETRPPEARPNTGPEFVAWVTEELIEARRRIAKLEDSVKVLLAGIAAANARANEARHDVHVALRHIVGDTGQRITVEDPLSNSNDSPPRG
jgi:hypothetical protein